MGFWKFVDKHIVTNSKVFDALQEVAKIGQASLVGVGKIMGGAVGATIGKVPGAAIGTELGGWAGQSAVDGMHQIANSAAYAVADPPATATKVLAGDHVSSSAGLAHAAHDESAGHTSALGGRDVGKGPPPDAHSGGLGHHLSDHVALSGDLHSHGGAGAAGAQSSAFGGVAKGLAPDAHSGGLGHHLNDHAKLGGEPYSHGASGSAGAYSAAFGGVAKGLSADHHAGAASAGSGGHGHAHTPTPHAPHHPPIHH